MPNVIDERITHYMLTDTSSLSLVLVSWCCANVFQKLSWGFFCKMPRESQPKVFQWTGGQSGDFKFQQSKTKNKKVWRIRNRELHRLTMCRRVSYWYSEPKSQVNNFISVHYLDPSASRQTDPNTHEAEGLKSSLTDASTTHPTRELKQTRVLDLCDQTDIHVFC